MKAQTQHRPDYSNLCTKVGSILKKKKKREWLRETNVPEDNEMDKSSLDIYNENTLQCSEKYKNWGHLR